MTFRKRIVTSEHLFIATSINVRLYGFWHVSCDKSTILKHLVNPLTVFVLKMVIHDRIETSHDFSNQVTDFYNNDQLSLNNQMSVYKRRDQEDVLVASILSELFM